MSVTVDHMMREWLIVNLGCEVHHRLCPWLTKKRQFPCEFQPQALRGCHSAEAKQPNYRTLHSWPVHWIHEFIECMLWPTEHVAVHEMKDAWPVVKQSCVWVKDIVLWGVLTKDTPCPTRSNRKPVACIASVSSIQWQGTGWTALPGRSSSRLVIQPNPMHRGIPRLLTSTPPLSFLPPSPLSPSLSLSLRNSMARCWLGCRGRSSLLSAMRSNPTQSSWELAIAAALRGNAAKHLCIICRQNACSRRWRTKVLCRFEVWTCIWYCGWCSPFIQAVEHESRSSIYASPLCLSSRWLTTDTGLYCAEHCSCPVIIVKGSYRQQANPTTNRAASTSTSSPSLPDAHDAVTIPEHGTAAVAAPAGAQEATATAGAEVATGTMNAGMLEIPVGKGVMPQLETTISKLNMMSIQKGSRRWWDMACVLMPSLNTVQETWSVAHTAVANILSMQLLNLCCSLWNSTSWEPLVAVFLFLPLMRSCYRFTDNGDHLDIGKHARGMTQQSLQKRV